MARYLAIVAFATLIACRCFGVELPSDRAPHDSIDGFMRQIEPLLDLSLKPSRASAGAQDRVVVWQPEWGSPLAVYPKPITPADMLEMAQDKAEHERLLKELLRRLDSPVRTVTQEAADVSRQLAVVNPQFHDRLARRMISAVLNGEIQLIDRLKEIGTTTDQAQPLVLETFESGTREARRRGVRVVRTLEIKSDPVTDALWKLTRSLDATLSYESAQAIGTEQAKQLARLSELFADLRANSKNRRIIAAKQLDELALYPKPLTTALVKAAEEGNMVVREGILAALEESFTSGREVNATLSELAKRRDVQGIYARAALAAVRE